MSNPRKDGSLFTAGGLSGATVIGAPKRGLK